MVLSDVENNADLKKIKQLVGYTQTKIGVSELERGSISVPTDKSCTLNSQHILNNNFCGEIISYQIDVNDVAYQKSYIVLSLYVPMPWYQTSDGKYIENVERNKLKLAVFKQVGNVETNISDIKLNIYRKNKNGKWVIDESGIWSQVKTNIVSAWVDPERVTNNTLNYIDLDYIETTDLYRNGKIFTDDEGKTYKNIIGDGAYNSNDVNEIKWSVLDKKISGNYPNLWLDKKYKSVAQYQNSEYINTETNKYNLWPAEAEEKNFYWNDTNTTKLYKQTLVTNYTSRNDLNKTKLTANIVINNYNSSEIQKTEQLAQNIIANIFIEEIGGGN